MLDTQPLQALLHGLLDESARQDPLPVDTAQQRKLLRTLMNVRPPNAIDKIYYSCRITFYRMNCPIKRSQRPTRCLQALWICVFVSGRETLQRSAVTPL